MNTSRQSKIVYGAGIFAILCGLLTSYLSPKIISWYFDPPVNMGVNCNGAVEWAMARLQTAQLFGVFGGMVLGFVVTFIITKSKKT
jgi:hypothetical protein